MENIKNMQLLANWLYSLSIQEWSLVIVKSLIETILTSMETKQGHALSRWTHKRGKMVQRAPPVLLAPQKGAIRNVQSVYYRLRDRFTVVFEHLKMG